MTFSNLINELYQEEESSTITHNGLKYDLNKLFRLSEHLPVTKIKVSDLDWETDGFKPSKSDTKREKNSDLKFPILVTKWYNKWVVLDGFHRLLKSENNHTEELPAKIISHEILMVCRLNK
jgi:hypothetical protein